MPPLLAPEWTWETQPPLEQSTETWEPPLSSEPCRAEQGVLGSLQPSWPFSQSPGILVMTCTCALETFFRNHQEKADPLGIGENFLESSLTFLCVPFVPPPPSTMGRCDPKSLVRRAACFAEDAHGEGTPFKVTSALGVSPRFLSALCK